MESLLVDLSGALASAFPHLRPFEPLQLLGSGFGSFAFVTPRGLVFRVARTAETGAQYAREVLALPKIAPYLPVAVPQPVAYLKGKDGLSFGVIVYPMLPGVSLDFSAARAHWEGFAEQLGIILFALQSIPTDILPWRDDPSHHRQEWLHQRNASLMALRGVLREGELQAVANWWDALLADARMTAYAPVVQHGDLWFGNLLFDGERITAVIDFQNVALGDPAQDFSTQLYLGERFLRQVMAAYQSAGGVFDPGFEHRLASLWGLREFGGLLFSIQQNDREEFAESVEKIRKGPILSRRGLDGWTE